MKKNVMKAFAVAMAVAFLTACSASLDSMLKDYEAACKKGDAEKAEEIMKKIDEKFPDAELTEEQQERVATATLQLLFGGAED